MALPTITNNSPAPGSIAWTTFNIQYNGQAFNIPAGNTAQKYVWWLYGGGTSPALQSGNAFPNLGSDDMVLFLNKAGIGVLVPTAELLDGSLIVGGSILAAAIGANEIQTTHLAANSVTATQIAANAVTATQVAANSITSDKLSVGTVSDSLVTNSSFEEFAAGMPLGWNGSVTLGAGSIDIVTGVSSSGANAARMVIGSTTTRASLTQNTAKAIPVTANASRKYYIGATIGAGTATTKGLYLRALWYDAAKVYVGISEAITGDRPVTTTFARFEGQVTPPANARYMCVEVVMVNSNVITNVYIDEVVAYEVVISAQIGDGQITTPKILANAVVANSIAAGAVTAKHLVISDFTNLIQDPLLTRPVGEVWQRRSGAVGASTVTSTTGGEGNSWKLDGVGTEVSVTTDFIEITPDQEYLISFLCQQALTGTSAYGYMRISWYKKDKVTAVGSDYNATINPQGWLPVNVTLTTPLTAYYCKVYWIHGAAATAGNWWIANPSMRRMNGGELIVDGAIYAAKIATDAVTTDKLIANAITGIKIAANTVTADKLVANTITAREIGANVIVSDLIASNQIYSNHLVAGQVLASHIDADAINGKTITGATVRTAATGARVVMDSSGLGAWNTAGVKYLTADDQGLSIDGTITSTGGTNWLGEDVIVKISDSASTSGGRNIAGVSFERENFTPLAFPAVYSDAGTDLMLTAANNEAFLSLANENSGGVAELQGKGINLFSNTGDVNIGKTYNTPGNLNVAKVNGKRPPLGLLSLQRHTGVTTVTTTDSQIGTTTVSVTPGMVLEISGSYAGGPSGASAGQYISWAWKANGVRFAENSHRSNTNGFGEGDSFSGFYTVPAGQTSVTISLWGVITVSGGTYVCPADSNSPKLQWAVKDIGDL